jgi:hypothetical protein
MAFAFRYYFTRKKQLIDDRLFWTGGDMLVFDRAADKWVDWGGTLGEWRDSIPVTTRQAMQYCRNGRIPREVLRMIDGGFEAPDPEED